MEKICRACPFSCKEMLNKKTVLSYCSIAPEGKQFNEGGGYEGKKPKSPKSKRALSNASKGKGERNKQEQSLQTVVNP